MLTLTRTDVRPFTDKQIELVATFADQAAIAIENVRLFDEIQEKSRQLAEASQHKSQFLANMSHELRTPLNAILGYTELIIDDIYGDAPDKMRAVLERVQTNGKHLLGLINDVLDLSKIEAGQLTLSLGDYSIKDVVNTVFTAVESLATEKKLALKVEMPPDLPPGRGDERRLTQVLLNLVGNAIKFTDRGEVSISASAANGSYTLAVRDTGPGIADGRSASGSSRNSSRPTVRSPRKRAGPGLGLAIAKRIIEMHGGRIWVESAPGEGATFCFTRADTGGTASGADMSKRILVVEDQEDNRQILRDLLGSVGYRDDRSRERRGGDHGRDRAAARPDPDGYPAADHGRLRGDPPHQGRPRAQGHPDHRRHLLCAERRRGQGAGGRLRRLCDEALLARVLCLQKSVNI